MSDLPKFTVWVSESVAGGTHFVDTYHAPDIEAAKQAALADCAVQWNMDVEDLAILGVVAGEVEILFWDEAAA